MRDLKELFSALAKSTFRQRFHLQDKDRDYLCNKGLNTILTHADDFISKRLAPTFPTNDGKQTLLKVIPYLWLNMQPPVAAVVVWQNGTKSLKENLCLIMKKLTSVLFLNIGYVRNLIQKSLFLKVDHTVKLD